MAIRLSDCYGCAYPQGHGDHCARCHCAASDDITTPEPECLRDGTCDCHGRVCEYCGGRVPAEDTVILTGEWGNRYTACTTCVTKWRERVA